MKKIIPIVVRVVFAVLSAVMLFTVGACAPREKAPDYLPDDYVPEIGGKVKVSAPQPVFPSEASRKGINSWINAFRNKYPTVQVEVEYTSSMDYSTLFSSKSIGDVYWLSDADCYRYAVTNEALMPLDSYIEAYGIDTSSLYAGITALCEAKGKTYFAGYSCGNVTFTYNVDAMVEAGLLQPGERVANDWTWEDFKVYAEQLKKYDEDGVTLTQVGAGFPLYWPNTFSPFIYAYGGEWADKENKKVTLYSDEVLRGIGEAIEAIEKRWIYPEGTTMSSEMSKSYGAVSTNNGCVFAYLTAYTTLADIVNTRYSHRGIEWDVAPWPLFPEKASPCGTLGFGVFSYTRNRDAAAALVLYLWTDDGQVAMNGQEGGDVPLIKKFGDQDFWHLTGEAFEGKNYAAFTANYEKYIPGQVNASVPPEIATLVEKGITALFNAYCTNDASWSDKLRELETKCNETWESLTD